MFDNNSRYKSAEQYTMQDHRGREVKVVATPAPHLQTIMGYHLWRQGQRPDHLASHYLNDPAGFWKLGAANNAMLAESLSEQDTIAIPNKS